MRWKSLFGGLVLVVAATTGCKQQIYLTKSTYDLAHDAVTGGIEDHPQVTAQPTISSTGPPATVYDPERPIRNICLAEAIAIALEQGTVGNQSVLLSVLGQSSPLTGQIYNDQQIQFVGQGLSVSDSIRVLALDPARLGSNIELALSKFDAQWITSATWTTTDRPVGTSVDTFQAGGAGGVANINQEQFTGQTGILKPLATGGVAGITFATNYTLTNLPARVNPSYQPILTFGIEQPLLQGFGVEINQLRQFHPGTQLAFPGQLNNLNTFVTAPEGILVTRIRFDQQRAEFERVMNFMVYNVEQAYWNLYNAYWQLYSAEQGLRQAFETYKISQASFQAGRVAISDLAQARGQYEQFRGQRLIALDAVLENERQLRGMLGMPPEDCTRLVPCDTPTLAPYQPDWCASWEETLANRPELVMSREDVKAAQLNVVAARNLLLPDLRAFATYDINGLGDRLDGSSPNNAFRNLASDHFNDWTVGLRLVVPLGFRNAEANLRNFQLQLAKSYESLHNEERKSALFLDRQYRTLLSNYALIRVRRAQRDAFAEQLKARFQEFLAGRQGVTLDRLLEAQRFWADALASEYVAIRDYNNSIAGFEFAKGTILKHNSIYISEGELPKDAAERATEHLRERSKAIKVLEHAQPNDPSAPTHPYDAPTLPVAQAITADKNLPLPAMLQMQPLQKDPPGLPPVESVITPGTVQPTSATAPASFSAPTAQPIPTTVSPFNARPLPGPQANALKPVESPAQQYILEPPPPMPKATALATTPLPPK
jgi:outer membrane protein TolC